MQRCSLVAVFTLTLTLQVDAGVFKCRAADGQLSFSNRPCAEDQQQLGHRLSVAEQAQRQLEAEKRHQDEQAALERRERLQELGLEEDATRQDEYEKMMQTLAGQVYGRPVPQYANAADAGRPESRTDERVNNIIRNLERNLVFEVESGNTLDPVQNSPENHSVPQVRRYLDSNLHAPGSLEIIEWGPVMKVVQFNAGDFSSWKEYRVRLKFSSKNRLGDLVRLDQVFILDESGQMLRVADFDGRPMADY